MALTFKKRRIRFSAGGWYREDDNDLVKHGKFGDGQIVSMMVGNPDQKDLDLFYIELKGLSDKLSSSVSVLILAYALAALTIFELPITFSYSGASFSAEAIPHVVLALITFASWKFSGYNTRYQFLSVFFQHKYFSSSSTEKAKFLLRYPLALPPYLFGRTIRGFPNYVHPARWPLLDGLALRVLLLIVLCILAIPLAIYGITVYEVWTSKFPDSISSKIYVIIVFALGMVSIANPSFNSFKRKYSHYGLTHLLANSSEDRARKYHALIANLRIIREEREERLPARSREATESDNKKH